MEKPRILTNTRLEGKVVKRTEKLNDLLLSAVDEALKQVFHEAGAEVIYSFLENKCHLKREEFAVKPEDFSAALERLLSSAAPVIEKKILENLCSRLQLEYEEKEGYGFSDYLNELREKYDVKK